MKAPQRLTFRDSWPLSQDGHLRASEPSSFGGKICGPEQLVERVDDFRDPQVLDLVDGAGKAGPEIAQHVQPGQFAGRNLVELFFQAGGKVEFDIALEEAFQEGDDDAALVQRNELFLVEFDIVAVAQGLQRGGIGGGPADAELFHFLHQAGLGVARRRCGEMLAGFDRVRLAVDRGRGQSRALIDRRQRLEVLVFLVVAAFLVERQETVEPNDGAGRAQIGALAGTVSEDFDGGAFQNRRFHLRRHGPLPDQLIELGLVGIEEAGNVLGATGQIGRPDGFVRLLGVFRLGGIGARLFRNVFVAEVLTNDGTRGGDRLHRRSEHRRYAYR